MRACMVRHETYARRRHGMYKRRLSRPLMSRSTRTRTQRHTDAVNSVAWSPDGRRLASGSEDYSIHVWDIESGKVAFLERAVRRKGYMGSSACMHA